MVAYLLVLASGTNYTIDANGSKLLETTKSSTLEY